jgi:hypothetical protein
MAQESNYHLSSENSSSRAKEALGWTAIFQEIVFYLQN